MRRMPGPTELSIEQQNILSLKVEDSNLVVTGAPGTGKTVIAFYRSGRLIKKHKNLTVLMYNKVLKSFFKGVSEGTKVASGQINTWWKWIFNFFKCSYRYANIFKRLIVIFFP